MVSESGRGGCHSASQRKIQRKEIQLQGNYSLLFGFLLSLLIILTTLSSLLEHRNLRGPPFF